MCIYWRKVIIRKGKLYVAFVDLRAAFVMVPRAKLRDVLENMGAQAPLLNILIGLHANTLAQARWGENGALTEVIHVDKGVRQGCVLAPTLFTLFINDVINSMSRDGCDSPKVGGQWAPDLLFVDDTLLISKTLQGLQQLLDDFQEFCLGRGLELNSAKTKCMLFSSKLKTKCKKSLYVDGDSLELVKEFDYLVIKLTQNMSWASQLDKAQLPRSTERQAF